MSHTCPFYWYQEDVPIGQSVIHNGTATVVDTGCKILVVTAEHVYRQYLSDRKRFANLRCQMGGVTVEPEKYLIDMDEKLDVATFALPPMLQVATGATAHSVPSWPPRLMANSELAILGGYPGSRRSEREGYLDSDFVTFITRASQSSETHVAFQLNLAESHWPPGERIGPSPDLGGMSGGPVFRLIDTPIERIELAGFIYQAHTEYEIVRARQAVHVSKSGRLTC